MISVVKGAHGAAALSSEGVEIMGGPDKPGHDD
jgi:hypothetical protein